MGTAVRIAIAGIGRLLQIWKTGYQKKVFRDHSRGGGAIAPTAHYGSATDILFISIIFFIVLYFRFQLNHLVNLLTV